MTVKAQLFDGTVLEFPDGTDPQVIGRVAKEQTAKRRQASGPQAGDMVMDKASGAPVAQLPPRADAPRPSSGPGATDVLRSMALGDTGSPAPAGPRSGLQIADGLGSALFDGLRQGVSMLAGAPVDIVNNAPRLVNLLPGEQGMGPMTDNPVGGSASVDNALRLFGVVPDYEPQGTAERILNRTGQEIGATAIPVGGAILKASTLPVQTINRMASAPASVGEGIAAQFLQPAAVNPIGLAGREAAYAGGAGLGAGIANEVAGENQGAVSDTTGSLLGTGATALLSGGLGALSNLFAGAFNAPSFADDVAGAAVAERLINSSSAVQEQAARLRDAGVPQSALTTDNLVQALRTPAAVENAVPGYRANIADRAQDPGIATLTYNTDAVSPGAAAARRTGNNTAVNDRMAGMAPEGDPSRFRTDLQTGVDARIGEAQAAEEGARSVFDNIVQALQPVLREASARGSSIRSALADAYTAAQENVRGLYGQLDDRGTLVDPTTLVEQSKGLDVNLAPNDAKRFRPTEADTIQEMMPGARAPLRDTGLVNEFNRPVFAESGQRGAPNTAPNFGPRRAPGAVVGESIAAPPGSVAVPGGAMDAMPGEAIGRPGTTVPLSDVTAIRSGLTDDLRSVPRNSQQARIIGQYIDAIDTYLDDALPPGMRAALDEARTARRDVGDRFERPGTALDAVLDKTEGRYTLDDSGVGSRIAQPDQGKLSDLRSALAEAGQDVRLRDGLADEVRSDVERRGLLNNPTALGKYMADRQVLLGEFPELRAQLEQAGVSREALADAERVAADTTKRLTTPGRSAEASYLKNVEDPAAAIRSVIANADPRKAVADLVATASTPQAKADLRAALWEEVKRTGKMQADGMTGETRWNGKKLRELFDSPKFAAVAEELWADDPADLADIKKVFGALASAEGSSRARAANTSGTPQSLAGKLDPALTASSISSRARSVTRGQLSPTIAVVDILGTWLRRRSAQVQSRTIDQITALVVNNPGMAADLLEKYNPATAAARRKMLTQKYGVRVTTLLNILDDAENEDPVVDAVSEPSVPPVNLPKVNAETNRMFGAP